MNLTDNDEWTALHHSARNGSYDLVRFFNDLGTDIHLKTKSGQNSLHIAAFNGHLNLCKALVEKHKLDRHMTDKYGWTALHHSAASGSYDLVSFFTGLGTDIHLKTNIGKNCLHLAAFKGHLPLCKALVENHKFDVHITDNDGSTALHHSARNGSYNLVRFFTDLGADIHLKTNIGENCLHLAAFKGHLPLCKALVEKHKFDVHMTDNDGWTALHHSAASGSYDLFSFFTGLGTDIHLKTKSGRNCLHQAACKGHLPLCKALVEKHKFDVHMTDNDGWTALHHSATNGSYDLLRFFADLGTDIHLKTNIGENCLHLAAFKGHLSLCKELVENHKFDVHMTEKYGCTALHHSAASGSYDLVSFFAGLGTDIHLKTNIGKNCLHLAAFNGHLPLCKALVEKHKFDVHMTDKYGWTALHHSAASGSYDLVSFFTGLGTDIHLKTNIGKNCLHLATFKGHLPLCKALVEKYKFDVHITDIDGSTALHHSARNGSYDLVRFFTDLGADIHLKTNIGENCLHLAAMNGHLPLCKALVEKHNFDVHMTDNDGWTALHHSATNGSYDLLRFFAGLGTDIHLKTNIGKNCLHLAAFKGHLLLCKALVEKHKFDVHITDIYGSTALHHSARNGSYDLVRFFTDLGADIHLKTNIGENCLHLAAFKGHLPLCKALVEKHKFDVHMTDNDGWTALHHSAASGSYELFSFFTGLGTDIHLKTKSGRNCLHQAACKGHLPLCKALVEKHRFDVHMTDNDGWTALHHSATNGSYDLLRFFADLGTDIHLKTNIGKNCLHLAAFKGHLPLCKALVEKYKFDVHITDIDGSTALHHSARNGSYDLVRFFTDLGADIHLKTNIGENCLHLAAMNGHLPLCKALVEKHKFDVHMTDNDGWTALHHSATNGSYDLLRFFAGLGTDIHLKTNIGKNCLHLAAFKGHLLLCKALVEKHKFDVHITDIYGSTALHHSARNGSYDLVRFFTDLGADIHLKTNIGENCLHLAAFKGHLPLCKALVEKHKFDVHMTDNDGWTALHHSAASGSYDLFSFFTGLGTDIHVKTNIGENCLHLAAMNGHLPLCKALVEKHKFDVHMTDNDGWTALHYSARNRSYDLVRFFTDLGADIHLKTNNRENCLHLAAMNGHLPLCKALVEKHKFDVHMTDNNGFTALHCSAVSVSYDLVSFFTDLGTDIHLKTKSGQNCLHFAALGGHLHLCKTLVEKHKFDVQMIDNNRWSALHCSAKNGCFDLFLYFLRQGSEIYSKTSDMKNVLHLSSREGSFDISSYVLDHFTKDYRENNTKKQHMLNGNCYKSQVFYKYSTIFLHAMDNDGNTYLHLACEGNQPEICELILKYDTEMINLLNKDDKRAMDIAKDNGHKDILNTLKAKYERAGVFFPLFLNHPNLKTLLLEMISFAWS